MQYKEGRQLADKLGFLFYEVSAKDNKFVNEAFERPAEQVIQKLENKEIVLSPGLVRLFIRLEHRDQGGQPRCLARLREQIEHREHIQEEEEEGAGRRGLFLLTHLCKLI